jgi:hypothetical protein
MQQTTPVCFSNIVKDWLSGPSSDKAEMIRAYFGNRAF